MRPTWDEHFLAVARQVAKMGTCARRQVGCVLATDSNCIVSTGHNGVPPGWPHCNEGHSCPGAELPSGTGIELCYANHAEANALLHIGDRVPHTCYVTTSPCVACIKLLLCTSVRGIVFESSYPDNDVARKLWTRDGRHTWHKYQAA